MEPSAGIPEGEAPGWHHLRHECGVSLDVAKPCENSLSLTWNISASIATIARIPYIHTLSNQADFLYATADVAIWSCCETGLAITACSSATLRPLFRHFLDRTRLSSSRTSRGEGRPSSTLQIPAGSRHTRLDSEEPIQLSSMRDIGKLEKDTASVSDVTAEDNFTMKHDNIR